MIIYVYCTSKPGHTQKKKRAKCEIHMATDRIIMNFRRKKKRQSTIQPFTAPWYLEMKKKKEY